MSAWIRIDAGPESIAWLIKYFVDGTREQLANDRDFGPADVERACQIVEAKLRVELTPARVRAFVQRRLVVDGVH